MFSFLQSQLHRRRGQLLRHLNGRPQGRGCLWGQDRQAFGRSYAEGGWGRSEGIPEGQREGPDQLLSGSLHHWRHGKRAVICLLNVKLYSGSRRLFLSETSSVTWVWAPSWRSTVNWSRERPRDRPVCSHLAIILTDVNYWFNNPGVKVDIKMINIPEESKTSLTMRAKWRKKRMRRLKRKRRKMRSRSK